MIEKLEINKKENTVEVFVRLKKKQGPRTPGMIFSWKNALENIQKKFPELVFSNPIDAKNILDNTKNLLEGSWIFPFINKPNKEEPKKEEPKKEEPKKEEPKKEEPKKTTLSFNKKKDKKQFVQDLTKSQEPVTVEETSQSLSDQPVIVQEPTE